MNDRLLSGGAKVVNVWVGDLVPKTLLTPFHLDVLEK